MERELNNDGGVADASSAAHSGSALRSGPEDGTSPAIANAPTHISPEEYTASMKKMQCAVDDTKMKMRSLRERWLAQAPFQPGDKVRVHIQPFRIGSELPEEERIVYIAEVEEGWGKKEEYRYRFNKALKSGAPSKSPSGIYSYSKVVLIERAPCVSAAKGLAPSVSEEPNEVSPEHSDGASPGRPNNPAAPNSINTK